MSILNKNQMSEEDIKLQYITPAITSKWDVAKITMETRLTDGKINLKGNFVVREKPKRADYVLYLSPNNPIAIIEAKDNKYSISHGLQQAMAYAQMLDLPFAYSSNGDGFAEHDFLTGMERQFGLDEFPTEDELIARYKQESGMTAQQEAIVQQPYYSSQNTYPPRYYQRIAINRTLDAIARGQDRLLLVMATGTGKTYTAFQIVYRLLQSKMKHKILYDAANTFAGDVYVMQDEGATLFERISKYSDITHIKLIYTDDTFEEYTVAWEEDQTGCRNLLQKSCITDDGNLKVVIG